MLVHVTRRSAALALLLGLLLAAPAQAQPNDEATLRVSFEPGMDVEVSNILASWGRAFDALVVEDPAVRQVRVRFLNQVHGATVVTSANVRAAGEPLDADAVTGTEPADVCAVRTADCLPVLFASARALFGAFGLRRRFAIAGVACAAETDGETVTDAKLVYFASEDRPTLASNAVAAIAGKPWSDDSRAAALAALSDDLDPMDNLQGSAAFKLHLQRVLTGRVLDQAIERARAA